MVCRRFPYRFEARSDPWGRRDRYVADLISEYRSTTETLSDILERLGFSMKYDDLAGPVYTSNEWPNVTVQIDVRHITGDVTPLVLSKEPLSLPEIESASLLLGGINDRIGLALRNNGKALH